MDIKTLRRRHPLKVMFARPGRYHLLLWWTYAEQNHLVVASSRKQMIALWAEIQRRHGLEASAKAYYVADLVAPPREILDAYAAREHRTALRNFIFNTGHEIQKYQKQERQFPPGVSVCPHEDHTHIWKEDCPEHCLAGYLVAGHTTETLYEVDRRAVALRKARERYQEKHLLTKRQRAVASARAQSGYHHRPEGVSRFDGLPVPQPNRPLYAMVHEGGNHQRGVGVWTRGAETETPSGQILFFFQGSLLPIPKLIVSMRTRLKHKEAQEQARQERARALRQSKRKQEQFRGLIELLTAPPKLSRLDAARRDLVRVLGEHAKKNIPPVRSDPLPAYLGL